MSVTSSRPKRVQLRPDPYRVSLHSAIAWVRLPPPQPRLLNNGHVVPTSLISGILRALSDCQFGGSYSIARGMLRATSRGVVSWRNDWLAAPRYQGRQEKREQRKASHMSNSEPAHLDIRLDVPYGGGPTGNLCADLYLPTGKGLHPALVCLHGGAWLRGSQRQYKSWGPWLAQRGYAGRGHGVRHNTRFC